MDPVAKVIDVVPLRRRGPARGARAGGPVAVVSVIEPRATQLIGALVLRSSLRRSPTPHEHRLCIVDRGPEAAEVVDTCGALGVKAAAAEPQHENPFLNKWLFLDAFSDLLHHGHVVLVDWDMLLCTPRPLPGPFGDAVAARRNPSGMYRDLIRAASDPLPRTSTVIRGRVRTSVNGGIMIGSGESLRRCEAAHVAWLAEVVRRAPEAPLWQVEQLGLSIAIGEVGLVQLDRRWNVTPQVNIPVADGDVGLWHYNNGVEASRLLKQCLSEPARARVYLDQLSERWPRTVALFSELYAEVLAHDAVAHLAGKTP